MQIQMHLINVISFDDEPSSEMFISQSQNRLESKQVKPNGVIEHHESLLDFHWQNTAIGLCRRTSHVTS